MSVATESLTLCEVFGDFELWKIEDRMGDGEFAFTARLAMERLVYNRNNEISTRVGFLLAELSSMLFLLHT